jgi:hypothetical protein
VRKALMSLVVIVALLACAGVLAGPATAAGALASWSERQAIPGLTERTIWGHGQVYVYRLPQNVTHTGDLHVELTYTPADCDCFVYLLGPVSRGSAEWQVCPGTYSQGFLALKPGLERVDYFVPEVLDQTPTPDGVLGDAYYVVVQAASGTSRVHLTGYLPRLKTGQTDTTSGSTFTRLDFSSPAKAKASIKVTGASYGGAFDLTPTSDGQAECRLQYPVNAAARTVPPATTTLQAAFEQYVYPSLWEPEDGQIPLSQSIAYGNWDLLDENRHAAAPLSGDDWYGLQGGFAVQAAGPWRPQVTYHYVPVLWLAAAAPYTQAPAQPSSPATGLRTVDYKATLLVPQNLRLAFATPKVQKGRRATLKGTLAVPAGSAVGWASPGTPVSIQRKVGAAWTQVRSVKTGVNGAWRLKVRVTRTTSWRAVAQAGPGLAVEYSLVKRTLVRR